MILKKVSTKAATTLIYFLCKSFSANFSVDFNEKSANFIPILLEILMHCLVISNSLSYKSTCLNNFANFGHLIH